jgi:hypothetical protein
MSVRLTKASKNGARISEYTYLLTSVQSDVAVHISARKAAGWDWQSWTVKFHVPGDLANVIWQPYLGYSFNLTNIREMLAGIQEHFTGDVKAAHTAWEAAVEAKRKADNAAQEAWQARYNAAKEAYFLSVVTELVGPEAATALLADDRVTVTLSRSFYLREDQEIQELAATS